MSRRTVDVDARIAQVLAEMSVISEAQAQRFGDGSHGGEKNNTPKGPKLSMADWWREAFRRANGPQARQEALEAAESALREARFSPREKSRFEPGTVELRLAIAGAEGHAKDVARKFGCSVAHVYNIRKISGRRAA